MWEWFLLLRKLVGILVCPKLQVGIQVEVKNTMNSYLELRKKLFANETFSVKHHLGKHYADAIKKVGPLCYVSSTRNDAYDQQQKSKKCILFVGT